MPVVVDTELAAGTSARPRARRCEPADVANAVADAIERPRFDVFVPRPMGAFVRVLALLPDRARVRLARFAVPNQVKETDHAARRGYEAGQASTASRGGAAAEGHAQDAAAAVVAPRAARQRAAREQHRRGANGRASVRSDAWSR